VGVDGCDQRFGRAVPAAFDPPNDQVHQPTSQPAREPVNVPPARDRPRLSHPESARFRNRSYSGESYLRRFFTSAFCAV
jgi:hypothetical protein